MGSRQASSCKNSEELMTRILQGRANLGKRRDILKNLCDSMPKHVAALLEAEEGSTKYQGRNNQQLALFRAEYWITIRLVIRRYSMRGLSKRTFSISTFNL